VIVVGDAVQGGTEGERGWVMKCSEGQKENEAGGGGGLSLFLPYSLEILEIVHTGGERLLLSHLRERAQHQRVRAGLNKDSVCSGQQAHVRTGGVGTRRSQRAELVERAE
jgi:hypothetical protein